MTRYDIARMCGYNSVEEYDEDEKRNNEIFFGGLEKQKPYVEKEPIKIQTVKHGRWIEQRHTPTNGYNYNVPYSTYVCSSCGLEIHNDEYSKYVRGTYTNCPVCTARMDVSG